MTSLSMTINEFFDVDNEFLFSDYQWFPCRWWSASSLSMIIEFLVDNDQWLPCRWWSISSLSMITSSFSMIIKDFRVMMIKEFLVNGYQWFPCRWVDDDQRVPCQWLSVSSLSLMINDFLAMIEFLVDDQWLPCRWWSMSSLSLIIIDFLVDDQWLPFRWWSASSLSVISDFLSLMINDFLVDDDATCSTSQLSCYRTSVRHIQPKYSSGR
jgi:hypothetical protein